jgi:type VI protein secretion system component VasK
MTFDVTFSWLQNPVFWLVLTVVLGSVTLVYCYWVKNNNYPHGSRITIIIAIILFIAFVWSAACAVYLRSQEREAETKVKKQAKQEMPAEWQVLNMELEHYRQVGREWLPHVVRRFIKHHNNLPPLPPESLSVLMERIKEEKYQDIARKE